MKESKRLDWIDVARGIAMIFVYLGHWQTARIGNLAYSFHLQVFFVLSGFFASKLQRNSFLEVVKKKIFTLTIPMWLWALISFIILRFDSKSFSFAELSELCYPSKLQPNYWFLPVLFSVSILYFLMSKVCGKKVRFIISGLLFLLFGELGVVSGEYNPFTIVANLPIMNILDTWCSISGIPQWLFWYCLGDCSFEYIRNFIDQKNDHFRVFHGGGLVSFCITGLLFLIRITESSSLEFIHTSAYLNIGYRTLSTMCIIVCCIYFSVLLRESLFLQQIGKQSMIFVGLEFITHRYLPLDFLPMLNLGIPSLNNSVQLITLVIATLWINCYLADGIAKYFPILNGRLTNGTDT